MSGSHVSTAGQRTRRRAAIWIGMFILLLSLLDPLLTMEAAELAQGQPPSCDPGFVVSDDGTTCVEDPNAQQPDQPTEVPETEVVEESPPADQTATEVPALSTEVATEAAAPDTNRLTISVYRCDHPTFDPYFSGNAQMVIDQCVLPGSGSFTIESTIAVAPQAGGALEFQIGAGLAIQETLAPGYGDPIANCFLYDPDGNLADQIGPGEANGGYWKVGSVAGDVHCDWYQVDRGVGVVYIVNMACPAPLAFPLPTLDEMVATCTEPAGSIPFGVQYGQVYSKTGMTGGEFNDVFFDGISSGPIAIWAEPPAQFESARMFCQINTIDGVEIAPFTEVPVSAFRATDLTLAHDQRLHCSWFNIPAGPGLSDGGDPSTQPPGSTSSELRVQLHTCPPGYDPLAAGANPDIDCAPGPNGVTFTLTDQDPATADLQSSTGDSTDNAVTFGGLAPGDYTLTQAVPAGIDSSFILGCGGGGIDPIPVVVDGPLAVPLPPGVIQTCPWFNVPAPDVAQAVEGEATPAVAARLTGTGSLTMYVYNCPAGFDVSTVDANPQASCTPAAGIGLEMDDSIDDNAGWQFETGATGSSTIDTLAADTYSIQEYTRNGTTATFVWDCYDIAGSSARTDPLVIGTTLIYALADGAQVRCDWFNVVGGTGRVIVNSHACDNNVPAYSATLDELSAACTRDPGSIEYTIVSDTHQETQTASQTPLTLASFANVPSGYVAVVERLPDEWVVPVVWCQVNLEDATNVSPPARMNVLVSRQVSFELDPGQVVYCDWFNVARGNTQVQVTNHACPAGFDAYAADLAALAAGCTADPGAIDITVENGGLFLETKPAAGTAPVVFYPTPSGELRISEKLPASFGLPVVVCKVDYETTTSIMPPTIMTVTNGPSIVIGLSPGQQLTCDWYHVPGGLGMVSIWTQQCPEGFDVANATRLELEYGCAEDIETIDYTLTSGSYSDTASSTNLFRYADFPAVPTGLVTVTGQLPHGSGSPVVYCHVQEESKPVTRDERVIVATDASFWWPLEPGQWLICQWYNTVETGSTVTVVKWICPAGTTYDRDYAWYQANCTQKHEGVEFTLTHGAGTLPGTTDANGQVQWVDVPLGPFSIQERIPKDYGEPVVFCTAGSDVALAQARRMETRGGYLEAELTTPRTLYTCDWFNIHGGPSEVTIIKYTCPPGYDLHAAGADPREDCATTTDGVPFSLTGVDPTRATVQGTTGDAGDGTVTFGELPPGRYTAEETVPTGTDHVFVLDCTGGKLGAIRSYPLSTGSSLEIAVGAGESITCSWYNVPEHDDGRLTVVKYRCSTMTWTSDVDCEIYEDGQGFDLLAWNGDDWEVHGSRTTDGAGQATFIDLAAGDYWLDEHGGEWCHLTSDQLAGDGSSLAVDQGQETTVRVYNCSTDPADVGKVGGKPTKFPNTGVAPAAGAAGAPAELPAIGVIAGLLLLSSSRGNAMARSSTRRQLITGIGLPLAGSLLLGRSVLAQGDNPQATPTSAPEGVPDRLCLPATPAADGEADCARGPVPATLRIEAIGVDAPVEVLETVGGVMQQPSDEVHVAWYKESARLGEVGNLWIAGHLNWWNVPEAVFANLGLLRQGDTIVLLDQDVSAYTYTIEWVRQESNLEPPSEEVLGMTDHEAVTLITCGGQWDNTISEYDERTVARAIRSDQAS